MILEKLAQSLLKFPIRLSYRARRFASANPVGELEFTSKRYGGERGNYSEINEDDVRYFRSILSSRCVTDAEDIEPHNVDWLKMVRGNDDFPQCYLRLLRKWNSYTGCSFKINQVQANYC